MKTGFDLFILDDGKGKILYSPLNNLKAWINAGAAAAVAKFIYEEGLSDDEQIVINTLSEAGFFDEFSPDFGDVRPPVQVTLFPTDGCNLRCRYCYAASEEKRHSLSFEAAKKAVDTVCKNALRLKNSDFVVGFHGNGEPFTNFDLIKKVCLYTKLKASEAGLNGKTTIATNGVLSDEKLDWMLKWFDGVNISCDVLPEIQNFQRPMAGGGGSFDYVDKTLKALDEAGKNYGIRATLTAESVKRLPEIAQRTAERYPHCSQLHVEPAWECGRCLNTGETTPETDLFIENFLKAQELMPEGGPRLVFSACRAGHITNRFCSVSADSFVVTAEGLVTSCYEVCEKEDPRADRFIYGYYDNFRHDFVFDNNRLRDLRRLVVGNMPYCKDCFCKYSCAGDCAAKVLGLDSPENHSGSRRCLITRALTLNQLRLDLDRGLAAEKGGI